MDAYLRRFMFLSIFHSSTHGYGVQNQDLVERLSVFNMGILRLDVSHYNILAHECFHVLSLLYLFYSLHTSPQRVICFHKTIYHTSDPLSIWWIKSIYWWNTYWWLLSGLSWETINWSTSSMVYEYIWIIYGWCTWMYIYNDIWQ